jgi:hypothetical protein
MLRYVGNGIYETEVASGTIKITKDEIYDLVRDIAKAESVPTEVNFFDAGELWNSLQPNIASAIEEIENEDSIEDIDCVLGDLSDTIIIESQDAAQEYYTENYILVEKY